MYSFFPFAKFFFLFPSPLSPNFFSFSMTFSLMLLSLTSLFFLGYGGGSRVYYDLFFCRLQLENACFFSSLLGFLLQIIFVLLDSLFWGCFIFFRFWCVAVFVINDFALFLLIFILKFIFFIL